MSDAYWWSTAVGALGVILVLVACALSLAGMFGRQPEDPLPRFVGWAFTCMTAGALAFVASLLLMVSGAT